MTVSFHNVLRFYLVCFQLDDDEMKNIFSPAPPRFLKHQLGTVVDIYDTAAVMSFFLFLFLVLFKNFFQDRRH